MENTFNGVIEAFNALKMKFQAGEISRQEFIDEMKRLRIKDDQGRFWMIGAQTGKWYYFDGKDWLQAEPPSQMEKKAICVYCGFENKLDAEVCARCGGNVGEERAACPKCGAKLQKPFLYCPHCSAGPAEKIEAEDTRQVGANEIGDKENAKSVHVLCSVQPFSLFLFGGVLGVLIGVVAGAFTGTTAYFSQYLTFLPQSLLNLQGKLLGGAVYGLLGGFLGFLVFGCAAFFKVIVVNFILSVTGGIKFKVQKPSPKE